MTVQNLPSSRTPLCCQYSMTHGRPSLTKRTVLVPASRLCQSVRGPDDRALLACICLSSSSGEKLNAVDVI